MAEGILVVGSTGTVGRELVAALAGAGERVRAATRSPSRASLPAGAEAVRFDFAARETHEPALEGVDRVYLIAPSEEDDPAAVMRPFIELAARGGGRTLVLQSAVDANTPANGSLAAVERLVRESGAPNAVLHPDWFMDNFHGIWRPMIVAQGAITLPAGEARTAFIDARDIGAAAAAVLRTGQGVGREPILLTGPESLTYAEAAAVLSRAAGRTIRYVAATPAGAVRAMAAAGMPEADAEFMVTLFDAVRAGNSSRVTGAVQELTGRAPRTLAEYAGDHAGEWKAG